MSGKKADFELIQKTFGFFLGGGDFIIAFTVRVGDRRDANRLGRFHLRRRDGVLVPRDSNLYQCFFFPLSCVFDPSLVFTSRARLGFDVFDVRSSD